MSNANKRKRFPNNIENIRFNRIVVLSYEGRNNLGHQIYLCKCDCGKEKIISRPSLVSGSTKSCGCYKNEKISKLRYSDLTNQKFGELTVIKKDESNTTTKTKWICECSCGNLCSIDVSSLKSGHTKSCGCKTGAFISAARVIHGLRKTKEYDIWANMKKRCLCDSNDRYKDYGGRGIKVCDRWVNSFENFYDDMGECPKGFSLDRIDNDGDYTPENCKWSTNKQQACNKRNNILVEYDGRKICLKELSEETNINYRTLLGRVNLGWSDEELAKPTTKTHHAVVV